MDDTIWEWLIHRWGGEDLEKPLLGVGVVGDDSAGTIAFGVEG